jgi:hypothetical protein
MAKSNPHEKEYELASAIPYKLLETSLVSASLHCSRYKIVDWKGKSFKMTRYYRAVYEEETGKIISQEYYTEKERLFMCIGGPRHGLLITEAERDTFTEDGSYAIVKFLQPMRAPSTKQRLGFVWIHEKS